MKNHFKLIFFSCLIIILAILSVVLLFRNFIFPTKDSNSCELTEKESTVSAQALTAISSEQLKEFDGIKNPKIYIGFNCLIYDVTAGKDQFYGEGKPYHYLVARDATMQLKIFGGDIIKKKYPVVGILQN